MRDITAELIEEGRGIGREEGRREGMSTGIAQARQETAERMIRKNYSYSDIAEISQLDESEVERLAIEVRERDAEYSASDKKD